MRTQARWVAAPLSVIGVVALSLLVPHLADRSSHVPTTTQAYAASDARAARIPIAPGALGTVLTTVATEALQPVVGQLPVPDIRIADESRRRLSAGEYGRASLAQVSFVTADSAYTLSMDYSAAETEGLDGQGFGQGYCQNMLNLGFSLSCEATITDDGRVVIVETRDVFVSMKDGAIGDSEVVAPGAKPLFGGEPWTKRMVSVIDRVSAQRTTAVEWLPRFGATSSPMSHPPYVPIETLTALAANTELVLGEPSE